MAFFSKQGLFNYKYYNVDFWGVFKNSLHWKRDKTNYFCKRLNGKLYYYKKLAWRKAKDYYNQQKKDFNLKWHQKKQQQIKKFGYLSRFKYYKPPHVTKYFLNKIRTYVVYYANLFSKIFKLVPPKKNSRLFSFFFRRVFKRKKIYFRRPFIYEIRSRYTKRKKRRLNRQFRSLRIVRLFYIMFTYKQLKKIIKKAKKKDGLFEQNYLLYMENKLPSFIYRSSFIPNMFDSLKFIKKSNVWINKQFMYYISFTIKIMDLVGFRIIYKKYIYWNFFKRIRRKAFIFLLPKYIYTSYSFLMMLVLNIPLKINIINPIKIDMYRLSNYAI